MVHFITFMLLGLWPSYAPDINEVSFSEKFLSASFLGLMSYQKHIESYGQACP